MRWRRDPIRADLWFRWTYFINPLNMSLGLCFHMFAFINGYSSIPNFNQNGHFHWISVRFHRVHLRDSVYLEMILELEEESEKKTWIVNANAWCVFLLDFTSFTSCRRISLHFQFVFLYYSVLFSITFHIDNSDALPFSEYFDWSLFCVLVLFVATIGKHPGKPFLTSNH